MRPYSRSGDLDAVADPPADDGADRHPAEEPGEDRRDGLGRVAEDEHELARPDDLVDEPGRPGQDEDAEDGPARVHPRQVGIDDLAYVTGPKVRACRSAMPGPAPDRERPRGREAGERQIGRRGRRREQSPPRPTAAGGQGRTPDRARRYGTGIRRAASRTLDRLENDAHRPGQGEPRRRSRSRRGIRFEPATEGRRRRRGAELDHRQTAKPGPPPQPEDDRECHERSTFRTGSTATGRNAMSASIWSIRRPASPRSSAAAGR